LLPVRLVLREQRQRDPPVIFPAPLAAYRRVVVERARLVALVRRAAVVREHRAELVHLQPAARSAVAAVVVQAAAAAEQTRLMR